MKGEIGRMEERPSKTVRSYVWGYFDLITLKKVKCLICTQELAFSNNTSSMLRHLCARHWNQTQLKLSCFSIKIFDTPKSPSHCPKNFIQLLSQQSVVVQAFQFFYFVNIFFVFLSLFQKYRSKTYSIIWWLNHTSILLFSINEKKSLIWRCTYCRSFIVKQTQQCLTVSLPFV